MAISDNRASVSCGYEIAIIETGRVNFPNYIYITYDRKTGDAVVVDPGWDAPFIIRFLQENRLTCRGVMITHTHADHVYAADEIATTLHCAVFMSSQEAEVSGYTQAGLKTFCTDEIITCGSVVCHAFLTPGHTVGTSCFLIGNRFFTGDTLFIEGCGLCVEPHGSARQMFESFQFLRAAIPDDALVYPGHRYVEEIGQPFGRVKARNAYMRMTNQKMFELFCGRASRKQHRPPAFAAEQTLMTRLVSLSE